MNSFLSATSTLPDAAAAKIRTTQATRTPATTLVALATAAVVAAVAGLGPAWAEPYMAVHEGFACGDCHANRSGGGMRTLTAEMHASDILSLPREGAGILPAHDDWFSPHLNDYLSVGADFRLIDTVLFQDDEDAGGEVTNNTAFRDLESNDIDLDQATLYAELRLIPEMLSLYIDEQVAPGGASNREAFALLDGVMPWGAYLKAGRFFPAWGLKVQDDDAFISSTSGFSFDRTVAGVEVGHSGEGLNWHLSLSEGTEDNDVDQLVTASAYRIWEDVGGLGNLAAGASYAHDAPDDSEVDSLAAFGGFSRGPLTLLAQANLIENDSSGADVTSWAAYVEGNYMLKGWINTRLAFDFYDPDDSEDEDSRNRVSVGVEPFLDRFLQLRLFYRVYNGPEDEPQHNRDELTLEAHLFF